MNFLPDDHPACPIVAKAAGGRREIAGSVGVDSGQMVLSVGSFPTDHFNGKDVYGGPGYIATSSGYGDGGYSVVRLLSDEGLVVGVEVVFVCTTADKAVFAEMVTVEGWGPGAEELSAYADNKTSEERSAQISQWLERYDAVSREIWTEAMLRAVPTEEAKIIDAWTVEVPAPGGVAVGDPCYMGPSMTVELPPGTYIAAAWGAETDWGYRVVRTGLYAAARAPLGRASSSAVPEQT